MQKNSDIEAELGAFAASAGQMIQHLERGLLLSLCEVGKFSAKMISYPQRAYKGNEKLFISGGIFLGGLTVAGLIRSYRNTPRSLSMEDLDELLSEDSLDDSEYKDADGLIDATHHYRGLTTKTSSRYHSDDIINTPTNLAQMRSAFTLPDIYDASNEDRTLVIGVAGGSGSGKTTLCEKIFEAIGEENMTYIQHDKYYRDLATLSIAERAKVNFDHPDSLETELLVKHVRMLKKKKSVDVPEYDFATHTRVTSDTVATPKPVLLVEGLLIFADPSLASLFDIKIFVKTDDDIRIIRRIRRDVLDRGRELDDIVAQYMATVRPMHAKFVEPSKEFADMIIPEGYNNVALDMILNRLHNYVERSRNMKLYGSHSKNLAELGDNDKKLTHGRSQSPFGFYESKA